MRVAQAAFSVCSSFLREVAFLCSYTKKGEWSTEYLGLNMIIVTTVFPRIQLRSRIKPGSTYPSKLIDSTDL